MRKHGGGGNNKGYNPMQPRGRSLVTGLKIKDALPEPEAFRKIIGLKKLSPSNIRRLVRRAKERKKNEKAKKR